MTSNNALTRKLEEFARNYGADLFGVADLEPARKFISKQDNFPLDRFPSAVSVGMPLNDVIVERHSPEEARRDSLYWLHVYKVVTPALDLLGYRISKWLTDQGFSTFPFPVRRPTILISWKGSFPINWSHTSPGWAGSAKAACS